MAQDKILGEQLDLTDVSSDIANDPTAIGNIVDGVVNDPAAIAALENGIDHDNIVNVGANTHAQIDAHMAGSPIHFTQTNIDISANQVNDFSAASATEIASASIDDLSDVSVLGATTGQLLTYSNSPAGWSSQDAPADAVTNPMTSDLVTGGFNIITVPVVDTGSPATGQTTNSIVIQTGNVSADDGAFSYAGNIEIVAGSGISGTTSYGGYLLFRGGNSVRAETGYAFPSPGDIFMYGGKQLHAGGGRYAGNFRFEAGHGSNGNFGGYVKLYAGGASSGGSGGNMTLYGGNSSGAGGDGGSMIIRSGNGERAGLVRIQSGASSGALKPRDVSLWGAGSNGTADGGDVEIRAGWGSATYTGGDIKLLPGKVTGTSDNSGVGSVQIHAARDNIGHATLQLWNDTNTDHTTGGYVELKAPSGLTGIGSPSDSLVLTLPSVDGITGQALQSDGSGNLSFTGPRVLDGTGTPEGSVAAPQGSIYTDKTGAADTVLYIKESGTATVGWVVVGGSGGGVDNPLTADLDVATFSIIGTPPATLTSDGGDIDIAAGAAGATSGIPGVVSIKGGDDVSGVAGAIYLTGGDGNSGGTTNVFGGTGTDGWGGQVVIRGGTSATSLGGDVLIFPGGGTTDGSLVIMAAVNGQGTAPLVEFRQAGGSVNNVAIRAPATVTASVIWTLPQNTHIDAVGKVLTAGADGILSFETGGAATTKPTYEIIDITGSPVSDVVATTVNTVAAAGVPFKAGLMVYRNGAQQTEGVMEGSPLQPSRDFAVSGANEITFPTGALEVGNVINIYVFE